MIKIKKVMRSIRFTPPKKKEDTKTLAIKVLQTIDELKSLDAELFGQWCEKAYSKKEAMKKLVAFDLEFIENTIIKNWDKKFPELGCHIAWWSGKDDDGLNSEIFFIIGTTSTNDYLQNNIAISFPNKIDYMLQVDKNFIEKIKSIIEKIWNTTDYKIFYRE
jgi:hypothetical protein